MSFTGIAYTTYEMETEEPMICHCCEEIKKYVDDDGDEVVFDNVKDLWVLSANCEAMEEDYSPWAANHYEDIEVWFETEILN